MGIKKDFGMKFGLILQVAAAANVVNVVSRRSAKLQISLDCTRDAKDCVKATHALSMLPQYFDNALSLSTVLRVHVELRRKIDKGGMTVRPGGLYLDRHGEFEDERLSPQALYRTRNPQKGLGFDKTDIYVAMYEENYSFPLDFGRKHCHGRNQNFLDQATKGIIQGLGVYSSFGKHLNMGLISPMVNVTKVPLKPGYRPASSQEYQYKLHFVEFAYDGFLRTDKNDLLSSFTRNLNHCPTLNFLALASPSRYNKQLKKSLDHLTHLIKTTDAIRFHLASGRDIKLLTGRDAFESDTFLTHFQDSNGKTNAPLFVGTYSYPLDASFKTAPFGENTLDILQALGYTKNTNPKWENSFAYYRSLRGEQKA